MISAAFFYRQGEQNRYTKKHTLFLILESYFLFLFIIIEIVMKILATSAIIKGPDNQYRISYHFQCLFLFLVQLLFSQE